MSKLERLLFLQGNRCFFCDQSIPPGEATVEHLRPKSKGGGQEDDNCVVCCRTMNSLLGNLSVKEKLRALLAHRGKLVCPAERRRSPTECAQAERCETVGSETNGNEAVGRETRGSETQGSETNGCETVADGTVGIGGANSDVTDVTAAQDSQHDDFIDGVIDEVIDLIGERSKHRPKKRKALRNLIRTVIGRDASDEKLNRVITELVRVQHLRIDGDKVTYYSDAYEDVAAPNTPGLQPSHVDEDIPF